MKYENLNRIQGSICKRAGSYYNADKVDAAIKEIETSHRLELDQWCQEVIKLEVKNRKINHLLWTTRATRAEHMKNLCVQGEYVPKNDNGEELDWKIFYRKWANVEKLCRAKAKKFE